MKGIHPSGVMAILFEIPLLLAVDTSAVGLTVHVSFLGGGNAFFPADPEVVVVKRDALGFAYRFAHLLDCFMLLKLAVEERTGKAVKFPLFGNPGSSLKPVMIAVAAPVALSKSDAADKALHVIILLVNDAQIFICGKALQGFLPAQAFRIWMDVMAIKKSHDIESIRFQYPERIDGAWCAAEMKQYLQLIPQPFNQNSGVLELVATFG